MLKWTKSLKGRLIAVMLVVFALGAANVVIYLLDIDQDLRSHIMNKQVDTILAVASLGENGSGLENLPTAFSESSWRFALYDRGGRLQAAHPPGSPPPFMSPEQETINAQNATIARELGELVLVVSKSDQQERQELRELIRVELAGSTLVIMALGLVSLVVALTLAAWILRSVSDAAALARTIDADKPERRIPLENLPMEVRPLAVAANEALERLAKAYATERRFTAEAAHELRTPLAVLSLRLQKARSQTLVDWQSVDREMQQMTRLVAQLTALARAEGQAALPPDTTIVSISRVAREAVADMMLLFEAAGREVEADIEDGLKTAGNAGQFRQAMQNLLENSLVHGRGTVHVALSSYSTFLVLEIDDDGPAPPASEAESLFERFHKWRQTETGSGLGLAIVRQIARNAGGDATIIPGGKFKVRITLPSIV